LQCQCLLTGRFKGVCGMAWDRRTGVDREGRVVQ